MLPSVTEVVEAFDRILRRDLTASEYREVRRLNATTCRNDPGVCASHDFLDANMTMLEAVASVSGKSEDEVCRLTLGDGDDIPAAEGWHELWCAAWDAWKTGAGQDGGAK